MWKPKQPLKVVPLSNYYYIVSFSSREDRDYAFYEGPWMLDDHYLLVQRWRPNFNTRKADCPRKIALWVWIPDLPIKLSTVEALGCWLYGHTQDSYSHRKVSEEVHSSKNEEGVHGESLKHGIGEQGERKHLLKLVVT
ncbi:hypothetical protein K1719_036715 [Acacia pycnantha]|nr:hypothetical protein K1719_036715 [Acacia pycnantha]